MSSRRRLAPAGAALAVLAALTSCAGRSCDELPRLQAEREQARQDYLVLARSGASPDETARADEQLHALERRVHDVEQDCGDPP